MAQRNCAAASKRAAEHSRDSHWTASCSCAGEARRSARYWNNSGGCCCSLARKAGKANYCCRAVLHRLPTADDHSSLERNSAAAHSSVGSSCRTLVARVRGRSHCLALPKSARCFPGAVGNCCLQGCSWIGLNSVSPKAAGSAMADSVAAMGPNCLAHSRNVRSCSMSHSNWTSPKAAGSEMADSVAASRPNCRAHFRNVRWCSVSDSNWTSPKAAGFERDRAAALSFPNWLECCLAD